MYDYENKSMDDQFLFQKDMVCFFQEFNIRWNFLNRYKHLLVLDGDGYHITLEAIKQTQEFVLDMNTLPSHASHVF
jgi:hypothetical protein